LDFCTPGLSILSDNKLWIQIISENRLLILLSRLGTLTFKMMVIFASYLEASLDDLLQ
jgi:hypothetical protein